MKRITFTRTRGQGPGGWVTVAKRVTANQHGETVHIFLASRLYEEWAEGVSAKDLARSRQLPLTVIEQCLRFEMNRRSA